MEVREQIRGKSIHKISGRMKQSLCKQITKTFVVGEDRKARQWGIMRLETSRSQAEDSCH